MKPGGYSDSGADIAYSLWRPNIDIITPVDNPKVTNDYDWVFPDTTQGIQQATDKGANLIWLNTVLYKGHPIEAFIDEGIAVVGQLPRNVDVYDDKLVANKLLARHHLPIPKSAIITAENIDDFKPIFPFPVVVKPVRGRGSQGVSLVNTQAELTETLNDTFASGNYGNILYVEEYFSGQEVTITVMPPGNYSISDQTILKKHYWSLPPVRRFNHENGVAPYNGTVAVINNSEVLNEEMLKSDTIQQLCRYCEEAAKLINAKAPIRIDCRSNALGKYFLFDLNMKPNMTGASRAHRPDQDSLTALAARKIGWDFDALTLNMIYQYWNKQDV